MKVSKEWKIAWFTILAAPLVASIWDFIKSGNQFNFQSLKLAYQWFISGKLPVWMVVLLLISVLLISWIYRSLKSGMSEIQTNIDDTTAGSYYDNNPWSWYLQYNKDEFRGYTFRWGYKWSEESEQWIISDLTTYDCQRHER